jgi:hypothetical protein
MLALRPTCEHCHKALPFNSTEAMICSFECTFCKDCVEQVLINVCPNCGGGFEKRPIRPQAKLINNPASTAQVHKELDTTAFQLLLYQYKKQAPEKR